MAELAPGVHDVPVLYRRGNSIVTLGLLVGETLTLIDAGGPGAWEDVERYLRGIGREPREVTRIVMTHRHIDHSGGLREIKAATGAVVAAGGADIPYIDGRTPHFVRPGFEAAYAEYRPVAVEETLAAGQRLAGFEEFEVLETPGHTGGHLCFHDAGRGILFAGDLLKVVDGRVAGPTPEHADDVALAYQSVRRLAGLRLDTVVAAHGGVLVGPDVAEQVRALAASLRE